MNIDVVSGRLEGRMYFHSSVGGIYRKTVLFSRNTIVYMEKYILEKCPRYLVRTQEYLGDELFTVREQDFGQVKSLA